MTASRWTRRSRILTIAALGAVMVLAAGTIAAAALPEQPGPKTRTFSGDLTGVTQGLPIDQNGNGHMATITEMVSSDFVVSSYAETDQLPEGDPARFCELPDGSTGVVSHLVPGGGQAVWNYPKTESQLWTQVTFRELCAGFSGATIYEEAEIVGGWGEFQGATGTIISTNREGHATPFRQLQQPGQLQLTVPQLSYVFVATTAHYEIEVTVPR